MLSSLTPAKSAPVINNGSPTILGKRSYEQHNGVDGNMKKRLLMPSRGKAWGGRWWGAVAESCRDACVYCLLADWAVQGTYRGNPRRPSTETQATAHTSMLVM